jgi:hypothetical protein
MMYPDIEAGRNMPMSYREVGLSQTAGELRVGCHDDTLKIIDLSTG